MLILGLGFQPRIPDFRVLQYARSLTSSLASPRTTILNAYQYDVLFPPLHLSPQLKGLRFVTHLIHLP